MADLGQTGGRAIKWLEHFGWKDLLQARQWLALWKMWIAHKSLCHLEPWCLVKFVFSKKATKIDEIFTVDLTLCSKCQIDVEDFIKFLWPS